MIGDFEKIILNEEKMKFLIRFAVLAPSSHNSQPWSFSISNNRILVSKEEKRRLHIGDVNDRQLSISLGCAIENIVVAADYYGYDSIVNLDRKGIVAQIDFTPKSFVTNENKSHLIFSIPKRMVNRSKYLDKHIDAQTLNMIKSLGGQNLKIDIITDKGLKDGLTDIALASTSASMSSKAFRKELSHYVISNTSSSKVGMPGFSLGFPTPVSYIAPLMLRIFNMSKLSNKKDEIILKKATPYMIVVSTRDDDQMSWILAGRTFQKISLILTSKDISLGVWAAPIQIGEYYKDIQKLLKINFRPQIFSRMGYSSQDMGGHSPRLNADDVIKK